MQTIPSLSGAVKPADETRLYGAPHPATKSVGLVAGSMRLTYADGELRRLLVGDKEIIRRIYVSVRDPRWDTAEPKITRFDIQQSPDSFSIQLEGLCRDKGIDFTWQGEITGTSTSRVAFRVKGAANTDCQANRFGMCVLYGAESLAGQAYDVFDANGQLQTGAFPGLPDKIILNDRFQSLRYQTVDGMVVTTEVKGTLFGMEDQRQFGDSSYKAFSAMPFTYPQITAGAAGTETISIQVENAKPVVGRSLEWSSQEPTVVRVGDPWPGTRLPQLLPYDKALAKPSFFMDISNARKTLADAALVAWPFNVAVNLFDEETWIENLPAVADQLRATRSFAPRAVLRVAPVTFNPPYPRERRDSHNQGVYAAAWTAAAIKYLAQAGADEAMFDIGPGYADTVRQMLAGHHGQPLLTTAVASARPLPFEALAFNDRGSTFVCLINLTSQPRRIQLEGFPAGAGTGLELQRVTADTPPPAPPLIEKLKATRGPWPVSLSAFEVCLARLSRVP